MTERSDAPQSPLEKLQRIAHALIADVAADKTMAYAASMSMNRLLDQATQLSETAPRNDVLEAIRTGTLEEAALFVEGDIMLNSITGPALANRIRALKNAAPQVDTPLVIAGKHAGENQSLPELASSSRCVGLRKVIEDLRMMRIEEAKGVMVMANSDDTMFEDCIRRLKLLSSERHGE